MGSRKFNKGVEVYTTNINMFIERLKKARALNCDPSLVGMESYILKKLPFHKLNVLTRSL